MSSTWKLIKDILFALLSYWREKQEEEEQAQQRQQEALRERDRKITAEVEHERREVEEQLEKAGRSADAYRDAFDRVRRRQQFG
jgi:hypothetical protein